MHIERHNGRHIVCQHIFTVDHIRPGQLWQGSGGATVTVTAVVGDTVIYQWRENGETRTHDKASFAFQCRYCLVVSEALVLQLRDEVNPNDGARQRIEALEAKIKETT